MFDFIEQGIVSPRDADFTARFANQRTRRVDLQQKILLVERLLSAADRRIATDAVTRLGEVITDKLRSQDAVVRQGYARRFIAKVVVAPDLITISGALKSLEIAVGGARESQGPMVPSIDRKWCRLQDSNL